MASVYRYERWIPFRFDSKGVSHLLKVSISVSVIVFQLVALPLGAYAQQPKTDVYLYQLDPGGDLPGGAGFAVTCWWYNKERNNAGMIINHTLYIDETIFAHGMEVNFANMIGTMGWYGIPISLGCHQIRWTTYAWCMYPWETNKLNPIQELDPNDNEIVAGLCNAPAFGVWISAPPGPPSPCWPYLEESPYYQKVTQGATATFPIKLLACFGSPPSVSLSLRGLPLGASYSFSQPTVQPEPTYDPSPTSILTVETSNLAGFYSLTITGTISGQSIYTKMFLIVEPKLPQIAFISGSGSYAELYTIAWDRTSLKRLTYNSSPESSPSISEDGQWIAFISGGGTSTELWVMRWDGTSLRRLTHNFVAESNPSINNDGQWIAFIHGSGTSAELYVVKRDGTGLRRLTYNSVPESNPAISGDGQWIAFISGSGSSAELYVIESDGTGLKRLTYNSAPESSPSISYDGYWIAFIHGSDTSAELYVISGDGATLRRLTWNSVPNSNPSISSDGQWIAFVNNEGSLREIYVIKADGTSLKRLTYNIVADSSTCISGDGHWIAFIHNSGSSAELYVISRDGSTLKRLTYNSVLESDLSIS